MLNWTYISCWEWGGAPLSTNGVQRDPQRGTSDAPHGPLVETGDLLNLVHKINSLGLLVLLGLLFEIFWVWKKTLIHCKSDNAMFLVHHGIWVVLVILGFWISYFCENLCVDVIFFFFSWHCTWIYVWYLSNHVKVNDKILLPYLILLRELLYNRLYGPNKSFYPNY